jgi:hypothetical protein
MATSSKLGSWTPETVAILEVDIADITAHRSDDLVHGRFHHDTA